MERWQNHYCQCGTNNTGNSFALAITKSVSRTRSVDQSIDGSVSQSTVRFVAYTRSRSRISRILERRGMAQKSLVGLRLVDLQAGMKFDGCTVRPIAQRLAMPISNQSHHSSAYGFTASRRIGERIRAEIISSSLLSVRSSIRPSHSCTVPKETKSLHHLVVHNSSFLIPNTLAKSWRNHSNPGHTRIRSVRILDCCDC